MEAVRTGRQLAERGPQLQPSGAVRGRDRADHRADPSDSVHLDDDPFLATGRRDKECRKARGHPERPIRPDDRPVQHGVAPARKNLFGRCGPDDVGCLVAVPTTLARTSAINTRESMRILPGLPPFPLAGEGGGEVLLLKLQQRQLDLLQPRPLFARHVLGFRLRQELGIEGPGLENLLFLFLREAPVVNDVHRRREEVPRVIHDRANVRFSARVTHMCSNLSESSTRRTCRGDNSGQTTVYAT